MNIVHVSHVRQSGPCWEPWLINKKKINQSGPCWESSTEWAWWSWTESWLCREGGCGDNKGLLSILFKYSGGGDLRPGRRGGRRGGGDGQAQRRQHRPSHLSLRGRGNMTCGGGTDNHYWSVITHVFFCETRGWVIFLMPGCKRQLHLTLFCAPRHSHSDV